MQAARLDDDDDDVRQKSVPPDAFARVVKMMNHTEL